MSEPNKAVRYLISGRVQGVYYRASAVEEATRLGLSGWARNLRDGTVEVVAMGPPVALSALASWLWQGPPAAKVESVTIEEWLDAVPSGFGVKSA